MNVLSIDPSSSTTGIAFFQNNELHFCQRVSAKGTSILERMLLILPQVKYYIELYKPEKIAIETPYLGLSKSTSMKMGEIFGMFQSMFLFECGYRPCDILEIHPMTAKKAITVGSFANRSDGKLKTLQIIKELYPDIEIADDNVADAIAVGLAGINMLKEQYEQNRNLQNKKQSN